MGIDRIVEIDTGRIVIVAEFFERHGDLLLIRGDEILFSFKGRTGTYAPKGGICGTDIFSYSEEELKSLILKEEKVNGLTPSFIRYIKSLGEEVVDVFVKRQFKPCFNHKTFSPFLIPCFEEAGSMNQAVIGFLRLHEEERRRKKLESHRRAIDRKILALKNTIEELKRHEDYEKYRYYGDILMAYAQTLKRENPVRVKGFMGEDLVIEIDPSKTLQENARDYYKKYKKGKAREERRMEMISRLEEEIHRLNRMREHIEMPQSGSKPQLEKPFREFTTENGFKILVGKNAKGNEIITFSIAKPYDLFFYVREAPGSHVILRLKEKGREPPKEDVEWAASLAAWFSKAKHSNIVPVQYTEVRYLRKPRKGKKGKVILTREKVIFVQPKKPNHT